MRNATTTSCAYVFVDHTLGRTSSPPECAEDVRAPSSITRFPVGFECLVPVARFAGTDLCKWSAFASWSSRRTVAAAPSRSRPSSDRIVISLLKNSTQKALSHRPAADAADAPEGRRDRSRQR